MFVEKTGNIFDSTAQVIGHGVNIRGVMGAGIAREVADRFPRVKSSYQQACRIGWFQKHGVQFVRASSRLIIANIFTQVDPGRNATYDLIERNVRETLKGVSALAYSSLALPRIGSGIGGLDQNRVEEILRQLSADFDNIRLELWTYEKV